MVKPAVTLLKENIALSNYSHCNGVGVRKKPVGEASQVELTIWAILY